MKHITIALILGLITGCGVSSPNTLLPQIFNVSLPIEATNIQIDRPSIWGRLRADYVVVEFTLPADAFTQFTKAPPSGYSEWGKLGEIFVPGHLITYAEMPKAKIAEREETHSFEAIIYDPQSCRVFLIHYTK